MIVLIKLGVLSGASDEVELLVIGETFAIDSKALGETRRINVYLPAGYKGLPGTRFPVLYMPDGGIAEDFLHIAGLLHVSAGNGTIRPFLLVGIENTQRRRDLTGPTDNDADRKIAPKVGGSEAFRKFLREELMPKVKARYRTTEETAIVGESLAGLFVIETLLLEPDLFDTYIAIDPSLWWDDRKLVKSLGSYLGKNRMLVKKLYFASSNEREIEDAAQALADGLARDAPPKLTWRYEKMPGEKHSTIFHPAALKAFRSVFEPSEKKPD